MLRRLYDWTMSIAASRHAERGLFTVSFTESSFFPVPPDVVLIPMVLADRTKWLRYATICTAASVLGAILGYVIGMFLYETIGAAIVDFYGMSGAFEEISALYNSPWGAWAVLFGALTPFPYKVLTIFSGAVGYNLFLLILISIPGRGLRFFLVAGLLYWIGEPVRHFIERYLGILFTIFMVLLIGGFYAVRYVI